MTLRVAIGIPTYRRPAQLAQLLAALPERIAEVPGDVEVVVLVVDNDEATSARAAAAAAPLPVRYAVEPHPGIAAVRNRLLDLAGACDLLAFIDDDELPLPGWLSHLVTTWQRTGSAAVMGRVISVFDRQIDPWILETGVFRRRSRPTGLELAAAAAGNLLVDLAQVRDAGVRFDPSLGLAGGEDTLFSKQLIAAGGRVVWCDESRAEDPVPPDRMTRRWAMQRAFNGGNTAVQVELRLEPGPGRHAAIRLRRGLGGSGRAVMGWLRHVAGRARGDIAADARGMRTAYRGLGMVAGALGHAHRQYARTEQGALS
ncbi:glycosyltransferase [Agrococcus sp. Marseille-Q4369]|uniref:glycosyltransferase family 2 protein n=1 Tax=Agrococcus sp. Marseille-Q4369 TaxID=2810513 RepID=UPI001B8C3723|nr:glycosyltransferase [Agrococcus sp. Marseille-Q4369]QUW18934.1 glycosyltransferase [Agrococcus sp. Marseille-Q4369]